MKAVYKGFQVCQMVAHIKIVICPTVAISAQVGGYSLEPLGEVLGENGHTAARTGMSVQTEDREALSLDVDVEMSSWGRRLRHIGGGEWESGGVGERLVE